MLLLIDNYDSFTYNLVQRFGEIDSSLAFEVRRNDELTLQDVSRMAPSHIVISPGPCTPNEAGLSNAVLTAYADKLPILGVCLGHQCIGHNFGGKVIRNSRIMHGKVSPIHHDGRGVFAGLPSPFDATRYHSLVIDRESWSNPDFEITAWTAEGEIMGVRHKTWPLHGVQFHPESFLTVHGPQLLANFLRIKV
jgi:anthranilate synthase/aminodeoxychorismate synthase-like glutamine amidotransferase